MREWRKLRSVELLDLNFLQDMIKVTKSWRVGGMESVTRMAENRN